MKKIIILLVLVGVVNVVMGAGPPVEWEKTFGGSGLDLGYSVQQTADGGYIIAGHTTSYGAGSIDVWLIKSDANGNELWNKTFGGSDSDGAYSVQQTTDGGYVIVGYTQSYGAGNGDVWLIKTDADGSDIWKKTFGGSGADSAYSVQQTSDGGYVIAGYTTSYGAGSGDVWLIKTDADGDEIWNKTFGGSGGDEGHSVQQTTDSGYIIAGHTSSYGAGVDDVWLIKTDPNGIEIWDKTFGGSGRDEGFSVQQTTDGGYILTGHAANNALLIKTDVDGNKIWNKSFGESLLGDYGFSVQLTTDGGYVIAGYTQSYGAGNADVWLIKTDASGNEVWDKTIGGSNTDRGWSVHQTTDGGYIVSGNTMSYGAGGYDFYLIKLSADCINQPKSDLTGDCKTDIKDFAVMFSEWLDCGQYDPNDCL